MLHKFFFVFLLCPLYGLLADNSPCGYVIGWGDNVAGEATGAHPFRFSTNKEAMLAQYRDEHLRKSTGATVVVNGRPLTNIIAVSAGMNHSLALKSDHTVVAWGWDGDGKAAVPPDLTDVTAISAGRVHNLALRRDGTVIAWGNSSRGTTAVPVNLSNVVAVAAGDQHSYAVKADGTVVGWGMAKIPAKLTNVVMVATDARSWMGDDFALIRDGTVIGWNGQNGEPEPVSGLSNVVAIANGVAQFEGSHYLALLKDGTVKGWRNSDVPAGLSNVVSIAAAGSHCLALKSDGTIVAWGKFGFHPVTVPEGLSNVVAIATGEGFCLAVTTNNAIADRFRQN